MNEPDERARFEDYVRRKYPMAGATDADDRFEAALWDCWKARAERVPASVAPRIPPRVPIFTWHGVVNENNDTEWVRKSDYLAALAAQEAR